MKLERKEITTYQNHASKSLLEQLNSRTKTAVTPARSEKLTKKSGTPLILDFLSQSASKDITLQNYPDEM